jgi:uncharacterized membrane protein
MLFYSKAIAAVVGLLVLIASRYGLDLEQDQQLITDAIVSIVTAFSVYFVPNKPTTPEQIKEVKSEVKAAAEEIKK